MKPSILLAILLSFSLCTVAQKADPPELVKTAFSKQFPGTSKVKWEKEGNEYEVNFVQSGKEMSAVFGSNGSWKETEVEIKVTDLPAAVTDYITRQYKGAKIKEAAKITRANGEINYEAEVNKKDVLFDGNGVFLREETD